uniref:Serine/threonine-protein kinase STK11 (Trinotate prediction) n=1 Tax=Henneguya salminicola TaxID=69463 RepID=A0A6G3MI29_HENSL
MDENENLLELPQHANGKNGRENGVEQNPDHTHDLGISYMKSMDILLSGSSMETVYISIDVYIMGRFLGSGTYSEVREAIDYTNLCRRAIKLYTKHTVMNKPFGKINLINEIRVLKKYKHKNIIQLYDLIICENTDTV